MMLAQIGIALASALSWLLFSDTPRDPEGYVRDTTVCFIVCLLENLREKFHCCHCI